jgi:hypothetical protein
MNKKVFAIAAALVLLTLWTVGSAYAQSDSLFCNSKLIPGTTDSPSKAPNSAELRPSQWSARR